MNTASPLPLRSPLARRLTFALATLLVLATAACRPSTEQAPAVPWTHTGTEAPYALTLSPEWSAEDPARLNAHADFAAHVRETLFLIVIPQRLPTFPVPDARAVKRASLEMMQEAVDAVAIERQGEVTLDGEPGETVFFKGTVEDERIQYIATYTTHAGWGYQIVAWGPAEFERQLVKQIDGVLATWKFNAPAPEPVAETSDEGPN